MTPNSAQITSDSTQETISDSKDSKEDISINDQEISAMHNTLYTLMFTGECKLSKEQSKAILDIVENECGYKELHKRITQLQKISQIFGSKNEKNLKQAAIDLELFKMSNTEFTRYLERMVKYRENILHKAAKTQRRETAVKELNFKSLLPRNIDKTKGIMDKKYFSKKKDQNGSNAKI